jgi:cell division protease FtsH
MEQDSSRRKQALTTGYLIAAAIGVLVLQWAIATYNTVETIPYSQFEQLVSEGKVSEVAVGQDTIQGKLKEKLPDGKQAFVTARVDPALAQKLAGKGVTVTGIPPAGCSRTCPGSCRPSCSTWSGSFCSAGSQSARVLAG